MYILFKLHIIFVTNESFYTMPGHSFKKARATCKTLQFPTFPVIYVYKLIIMVRSSCKNHFTLCTQSRRSSIRWQQRTYYCKIFDNTIRSQHQL